MGPQKPFPSQLLCETELCHFQRLAVDPRPLTSHTAKIPQLGVTLRDSLCERVTPFLIGLERENMRRKTWGEKPKCSISIHYFCHISLVGGCYLLLMEKHNMMTKFEAGDYLSGFWCDKPSCLWDIQGEAWQGNQISKSGALWLNFCSTQCKSPLFFHLAISDIGQIMFSYCAIVYRTKIIYF